MARVTKINVGGTNYDIAHEGELKNSGFEVVTALPTTGLFEGREVMYQGEKYIYYYGWNRETNPIKKNAIFQAKQTGEFNQLWFMMQYGLLLSNNENCVKKEDRLLELIDNETGDISTYIGYFPELYVGKTLRWTAFNPDRDGSLFDRTYSNFESACNPFSVAIKGNIRNSNCIYTVEYYKYTNATGDGDSTNQANFEWVTVFRKEMSFATTFITIPNSFFISNSIASYYIRNIRVSITPITNDPNYNIYVSDIDVFYFTSKHKSLIAANRLINYDAVIEPTQTGVGFKRLPWWMQYITQSVNWLKANKVALSVYNAKVAELVQADSDNNTSIQSVSTDLTELSNGLAAVARSGSYNDLTDTPTLAAVATSGDYNDLLNRPAFSGSYNDLTDKPTLFSGSYDDLTNKPTLATVATSGNYDDLLNTPALVFQNIGGTISSVQIPDGLIANSKLSNSSMSLNGITVNLGDTSILPWYVDYNDVDYPARIRDHWLQIYRNGVWANLMYLGDILPTKVRQITSLDNLDWYNEQVSEYEVDSTTTTSILNGTTKPATLLLNCSAEQLTLNLFPISGKTYGKGSLDSLITDLQGKEFSVFVENDLDAIIGSGSDYLVRIKISKVPTPKAIIECYVAK